MQKNNIERFLYHIYYVWHIQNCSRSFCYCGNKNAFTKNRQMWQPEVTAPVPRIHIDILVTSSFKHKRHLHSVRVWQHFKLMPWDTHTAAWVYRCIWVNALKLVYTHGSEDVATLHYFASSLWHLDAVVWCKIITQFNVFITLYNVIFWYS